MQDPPGVVPRLNASVEMPLGPSDMDRSPLCTAFRSPRTVALVGNGPLDQAQRSEIDSCDVVVRWAVTSSLPDCCPLHLVLFLSACVRYSDQNMTSIHGPFHILAGMYARSKCKYQ